MNYRTNVSVVSVGFILSGALFAQTNKTLNFSFETVDALNTNQAANWTPQYGGYARVATPSPGNWDGNFAMQLANTSGTPMMKGALQEIIFNQTVAKPILISLKAKGQGIVNNSGDKYGASLYCRVYHSSGHVDYCPTTLKTKTVGNFDWITLEFNTMQDLVYGAEPVTKVQVIPVLGAVAGTAWFDDVHVAEYDPSLSGFRGAITFRADDGFIEHYNLTYPLLKSYGFPCVEAAVVNYLSAGDPNYMNVAQLHEMENGGCEIMSHTMTHRDLSTLSGVDLENEFYLSKKFFADNGFKVKSLALPFGGYNGTVMAVNQQSYYFSSISKVEKGYNPMGAATYDTKVQELQSSSTPTTMTDVNSWIQNTINNKTWLIIFYHKVRPSCSDQYCVTETLFRNIVTAVQSSTLPVVTYEQGLNLVKSPH